MHPLNQMITLIKILFLFKCYASVAQQVERLAVNQKVEGSSNNSRILPEARIIIAPNQLLVGAMQHQTI